MLTVGEFLNTMITLDVISLMSKFWYYEHFKYLKGEIS